VAEPVVEGIHHAGEDGGEQHRQQEMPDDHQEEKADPRDQQEEKGLAEAQSPLTGAGGGLFGHGGCGC
jgi:hypothetical protein